MPPSILPPPPLPVARPLAPLPVGFLAQAAALPGGRTLAVALALCMQARVLRSRTVVFGTWLRSQFSISNDAALDALNRLTQAGLITADRRRGRNASVTLLIDDDMDRSLAP